MASRLWKLCEHCSGTGNDPKDPVDSCPDCGGHRELVFCSCCLTYGRFAEGLTGQVQGLICVPCLGDARVIVRADGKTLAEAVSMVRAKFRAQDHELATQEAA